MLNIAIFGAGGIGKYHAREFSSLGCNVTDIFHTNKENAENIMEGLDSEIDAVSICTPNETHYNLTKCALNKGIHVLCEKPITEFVGEAKELFEIAENNNLVLTENTQWPTVLNSISNDSKIYSFEMRMQPGVKGEKMLKDHLPHTNSMLIKLVGIGRVENIGIKNTSDEYMEISFDYLVENNKVSVKYYFDFKAESPRDVSFKINGKEFKRIIGENYSQKLVSDGLEIDIEDPLKCL